jgi:hypothetical protein
MDETKEFNIDSSIRVRRDTLEKINFLAHAMGKTNKQFLTEIADNLFCLGANYPKNLCLQFEISHVDNTCLISYSGISNLYLGSFNIAESASREDCNRAIRKNLNRQIKARKAKVD